jgi:RNA polymerase sigma-70 factor (ECF subfamily)
MAPDNPVLTAVTLDRDAARSMDRVDALDRFLRDVERRALRRAEIAVGQRDDALDLVQDAMLGFARAYAGHAQAEWPPLFHRVLESRILDFHRRTKVRRRWRVWLGRGADAEEGADPLAQVADPVEPGPWQRLADGQTRGALDRALASLPARQREAFLLRVWEGLDVARTAAAMGCGEGSVKTHLSRALAALRTKLEDWR